MVALLSTHYPVYQPCQASKERGRKEGDEREREGGREKERRGEEGLNHTRSNGVQIERCVIVTHSTKKVDRFTNYRKRQIESVRECVYVCVCVCV